MALKKTQRTKTFGYRDKISGNTMSLGKMPGNSHRGFCSPLGVWREDDPTLHPHCAKPECNAPIKTGDSYYIIPDTNLVVCIPCTQ